MQYTEHYNSKIINTCLNLLIIKIINHLHLFITYLNIT